MTLALAGLTDTLTSIENLKGIPKCKKLPDSLAAEQLIVMGQVAWAVIQLGALVEKDNNGQCKTTTR